MPLPELLPITPFTRPVRGEVIVPGSKSLTNRALLLAALGASYSTYIAVWIMIGHSTKPVSMATLPWILLALERLRERFTLANLFLLILPLVVLVTATHPQMMFYIGCATALYMVTELVARAISKQGWLDVVKAGGGLAIAGVIALGTHADMFLATREYTPESTRGSAPLVQSQTQQVDQTGGNDYEYATNWSFSPEETLTFLIPNYYGFGNLGVTAPGSDALHRCRELHGHRRSPAGHHRRMELPSRSVRDLPDCHGCILTAALLRKERATLVRHLLSRRTGV
jgi:hypothetical protein